MPNRLAYQLGPPPTWTQPSVVKGREQGKAKVVEPAVRNALAWLGQMIGADDPQSQAMGLMGTSVPSAGPLGGLVGKAAKFIKAYHGSPHDFDKFSTANIGTGEGAQAYGHGLYFAEKEGTAQAYKDALSDWALEIDGNVVATGAKNTYSGKLEDQALAWIQDAKSHGASDPFETAKVWASRGLAASRPDSIKPVVEQIDAWKRAGAVVSPRKGRMYEVAIKADPDDFLDWDAPLSSQAPRVKEALSKVGLSEPEGSVMADAITFRNEAFDRYIDSMKRSADGRPDPALLQAYKQADHDVLALDEMATLPGRDVYRRVAQKAGDATATARLKQLGVPGIKYLDQGSRSAGAGTRNYVVFDDATIEIMKKYGLLPPAIAGLSHEAIRAHLKQQTGAD